MKPLQETITGLTDEQVLAARLAHGYNTLSRKKNNRLWKILKSVLGEPMVLLLLAAAYYICLSGKLGMLFCCRLQLLSFQLFHSTRTGEAAMLSQCCRS